MKKSKRKRRSGLKSRLTSKPWQTIAFTVLLTTSITLTWILMYDVFFPDTTMKYGEKNYTSVDDFECLNIGSKLTNTNAIICCKPNPWVKTKNLSTNESWDTTECLKITNITRI